MTPFNPITRPMSVEFFSIYERDGKKYIHLWGYTYESDGNDDFTTPENPNGRYWANMEACGTELLLSEFLDGYNADEDGEYVDTIYQEAKQYQGDYDDEGIVHIINHYYSEIVFALDGQPRGEGNPDAWLSYGELTMDTPCGEYIMEY